MNECGNERRLGRRAFLESGVTAAGALALQPWRYRSATGLREPILASADRLSCWREARFGMFIHWGVYSILAGEWGGRDDYAEWIRNTPTSRSPNTVARAKYARYVEHLHGQVAELLTNYGDIGVMWFDGQWEGTWRHEIGRALYARCRALQPNVIVNNRVEGWSPVRITDPLGDFRTPEQEVPASGWPGVDWESRITMNRNWGYNSHDHDFKSVARLVGLLVETASKGGNLLLNVGPKADGTFPEESVERLKAIGAWMRVNGGAIYGSTPPPSPLPRSARPRNPTV